MYYGNSMPEIQRLSTWMLATETSHSVLISDLNQISQFLNTVQSQMLLPHKDQKILTRRKSGSEVAHGDKMKTEKSGNRRSVKKVHLTIKCLSRGKLLDNWLRTWTLYHFSFHSHPYIVIIHSLYAIVCSLLSALGERYPFSVAAELIKTNETKNVRMNYNL